MKLKSGPAYQVKDLWKSHKHEVPEVIQKAFKKRIKWEDCSGPAGSYSHKGNICTYLGVRVKTGAELQGVKKLIQKLLPLAKAGEIKGVLARLISFQLTKGMGEVFVLTYFFVTPEVHARLLNKEWVKCKSRLKISGI